MIICPKIKAALMAIALSLPLVCFSFEVSAYSEAQRASDFYKHQNYKKQQERNRQAAANEEKRARKQQQRLQERRRKQFIASGRNKKSNTDKYKNQYLKNIEKKQRDYDRLAKSHARLRKQKNKKRSRSQISENTEFGINTNY